MIYHGHDNCLDDLAGTVRATTELLRPHRSRFDSIAVTGASGMLVGSPVSLRLRKSLVVIRKNLDDCHGSELVINYRAAGKRYLFLDDFISIGATRRRVIKAMAEACPAAAHAGTFLYQDVLLDDLQRKLRALRWESGE